MQLLCKLPILDNICLILFYPHFTDERLVSRNGLALCKTIIKTPGRPFRQLREAGPGPAFFMIILQIE